MSYHVLVGEPADSDIVDILQYLKRHVEAGYLACRQILLGLVAGDDDLGTETDPCKEHFHLCLGRILGLIQDNKGVI